jgi:large subunit ribosomal protein L29
MRALPAKRCVWRPINSLLLPVFWQRYKRDEGMKARELREFSSEELQHKQQELIEELFNLRFQLATGQIENVGRIAAVRRDIARVKTVQRERQLQSTP